MVRVPGTASSLEKERAAGADIQVIYSPADGVKIASENPDKKIIFLGVGFETTAPLVAATLLDAQKRSLKNWFLLSAHKLIPPALRALAQTPDLKIDGFLLPGHVSAIIGSGPYEFISREYGLPCAITGFEPADIYEGIYLLVKQKLANRPCVEIQYRRAVRPGGNPKAVEIMNRVFETADSSWRGIGIIPGSGMAIAGKYSSFDAAKMIKVEVPESRENEGCRCGDVLKGLITPPDCPLFASACTPERPVGACMVSSEGACAAFYKYKRER
jgi:hydrogenase expression/formation protein HypD